MGWAQEEFKDLELGDQRRTRRLIKLVDELSAQPTGSIPLACGGWAETKAAYRWLDNPAVDWREILEVHTQQTVVRMQGQPGIAGLGRLSYDAQHGMQVHPTLAVTPTGVALGVLDAWMWARKPKTEPDVKESVRWVEGYHMVADLAAILPDTRLVYIADREGDLRALMDAAAERGHPADWLVRSKHNTLERLECALVIYLIIAWRILHLVTWGRDCPNLPCEVVFDPAEWQAAWIVAYHTKPPETPPPWVKWCD